jgi:NADH-quinone oxidoreductase subunit C
MAADPLGAALESIRGRFPETIEARGEVTVSVAREGLLEALDWLANGSGLKLGFLSSVTATDWPGRNPRFWVVYELRSITEGTRLRVKVGLAEGDAHLPSVTAMFPTADWHERETFDFFGIVFDGHPDLSRILLPDGWEGHPLLKTEPLGGVNTRYHGAFIPPVDERTTT